MGSIALTLKARIQLLNIVVRLIAIAALLSLFISVSHGAFIVGGMLFVLLFILMLAVVWAAGGLMESDRILRFLQSSGGTAKQDYIVTQFWNEAMARHARNPFLARRRKSTAVKVSDVASYVSSRLTYLEKRRLIRIDSGIVYLQEADKGDL